jgi:hypothetical protein
VRHTHITEEIKKTISAKQAEVQDAITTADRQLVVLENKLEELAVSSDNEETSIPAESRVLRQQPMLGKGYLAGYSPIENRLSFCPYSGFRYRWCTPGYLSRNTELYGLLRTQSMYTQLNTGSGLLHQS